MCGGVEGRIDRAVQVPKLHRQAVATSQLCKAVGASPHFPPHTFHTQSPTRHLLAQLAHRRKAVGALGDAHRASRVQKVEGVAELEAVVIRGHGQALVQQPPRLLRQQ